MKLLPYSNNLILTSFSGCWVTTVFESGAYILGWNKKEENEWTFTTASVAAEIFEPLYSFEAQPKLICEGFTAFFYVNSSQCWMFKIEN